ncbi:hypothetical protein LG201_12530 [Methylobacillus gramineus]|uniref:hypothetical protein n=1 Tax=Methylobacillus gramineus TaxID=755169 RepID=UPI001CFFD495|nr:hypothetical protein [Methylobacillus gramineus]MCB5186032.1 hypothetical protein [Methylobacillus gramineus]
MKSITKRHWGMALALLATIALVFSMEDGDDADVLPVERKSVTVVDRHVKPDRRHAKMHQDQAGQDQYLNWKALNGRKFQLSSVQSADLFKSHSWYVPPVKTASELAPPAPVAPEPAFAYMGKLEDGPEGTVILLASTTRLYSIAIGDTIERQWRLDKEDANSLQLTYLPLNLGKTLLKKNKLAVTAGPASHLPGDPDDLQGNL